MGVGKSHARPIPAVARRAHTLFVEPLPNERTLEPCKKVASILPLELSQPPFQRFHTQHIPHPAPRLSPLRNPLLGTQIASPAHGPAPVQPSGKPGEADPAGEAGGALGMLAGAGRARLRAASRKPSTRGGCGRERDGPRRWAHALRGLMPRASRARAQLAATPATRRHHLLALPGCRAVELQPSPRTSCRHCPPGPPPRLSLPPRAAAGPRTGAPGTRRRRRPGPAPGPRLLISAPCAPQPHSPRFFLRS